MGQGILDPDTAVGTAFANRGALRGAASVRRGAAFLNEIGVTYTLMLRVAVPRSTLAAASGTADFATTLAGDGGDDDAKVVLGQQRADAAMVFVVLRMDGWSEKERDEQEVRRLLQWAAFRRPPGGVVRDHRVKPGDDGSDCSGEKTCCFCDEGCWIQGS